jgi:hypothetical protein
MKVATSGMQRLKQAINYNVILYAVAAVAICYVVWSPTFGDTVFNFMFADVVPGSNRILRPEDVIMAVAALLSLGFLTLLSIGLFRHVAARRALRTLANSDTVIYDSRSDLSVKAVKPVKKVKTAHDSTVTKTVSVSQSRTTVTSVVAVPDTNVMVADQANYLAPAQRWLFSLMRRRRQSTHAVDYDFRYKISAALSLYVASLSRMLQTTARTVGHVTLVSGNAFRRGVQFSLQAISHVAQTTAKQLFIAVKAGLRWLLVAVVIVAITAITVAIVSVSSVQKFWVWLQPYASRLDDWLERQCRVVLAWTRRKLGRSELAQVIGTILRDGKETLRELFK